MSPTFDVFVDLVEVLQASCDKSCDSGSEAPPVVDPWPWLSNFQENKAKWKELCSSSKGTAVTLTHKRHGISRIVV